MYLFPHKIKIILHYNFLSKSEKRLFNMIIIYIMHKYYSEIIYGGVDGLITTFAIIAGSLGGNLSTTVIIILGLASILADGFSMGISSYLAEKSRYNGGNPIIVGVITFLSFILIGIFPLIPFFFKFNNQFNISSYILGILLFVLGYLKGTFMDGLETFFIGGIAAFIAYYSAKAIANYEDKINEKQETDEDKKK